WKLRTRSLASFQTSSARPRYWSAIAPAAERRSSAAWRAWDAPLCILLSAGGGGSAPSVIFFSSAIFFSWLDRRFFAPVRAAFDDEVFFNGDTELDTDSRLRLSSLAFPDAIELFCAKDDTRLSQVVGGQFDLYFVARHNPDEMFSHLARNMGKNIAL